MVKNGKGRQIISMKKIENDIHRHVTFSKRRGGLLKKATELGVLCGANVGLIIKSPGNKVSAFFHPTADMVINKYVGNINVDNHFIGMGMSSRGNLTSEGLHRQFNDMEENISIEKDIKKQLDDLTKAEEANFWWDSPDKDAHTIEKLDMVEAMLEELKQGIQSKLQNMNIEFNNYVEEPILDATTYVDPVGGMRYAYAHDIPHAHDIGSFDPITTDRSTGFITPYGYRHNDFNHEIPFTNNIPLVGGSHSSHGPRTAGEAHPTIQFDPSNVYGAGPSNEYGAGPSNEDGAGPSGTNIPYGSANDYNKGYH